MRVFVTGTDTNVGKTFACAVLHYQWHRHTGGIYHKPLQTGSDSDSATLRRLSTGHKLHIIPPKVALRPALAPQQAALQLGTTINVEQFSTPPAGDNLIVEGAGGVMVPIAPQFLMIDLIQQWQMPVVVIARAALGTINHTILTLQALQQRNIAVLGYIMNGGYRPIDAQLISANTGVRCLAHWPRCGTVNMQAIQRMPCVSL